MVSPAQAKVLLIAQKGRSARCLATMHRNNRPDGCLSPLLISYNALYYGKVASSRNRSSCRTHLVPVFNRGNLLVGNDGAQRMLVDCGSGLGVMLEGRL